MGHLRALFDPELGYAQWDADRRTGLVREVNALLEAEGEPPAYTLKRLKSWINNSMSKHRVLLEREKKADARKRFKKIEGQARRPRISS